VQQTIFDLVPDGDGPADRPRRVTVADARPYQLGWADAVMASWAAAPRCLGVAATGAGKTMGAALVARRVIDGELDAVAPGRRRAVLVVSVRTLLTHQLAADLAEMLPGVAVEVEQGADFRARGTAAVVSACLPSLTRRRLAALGPTRFQAVVLDEAHHYSPDHVHLTRVLEFFGPATRVLGLTATPDRGDGQGLGAVFDRVAFDYPIWQAVSDGYLVPPYMAYETCHGVRLDGVPTDAGGDFSADALNARMMEAGPVAAVVKAARYWSNYSNGRADRRPTLVCCASVPHAKLVATLLNEWHRSTGSGAAAAVFGAQHPADREVAMKDFREGRVQYICHFDVLTEGFDSELPKVMVNGRPTRMRWVFAQNAGRLLRPARDVARRLGAEPDAAARRALIAASSKPGAMIVDVAGCDHKLSVDLLDVFSRPADPPRLREEAAERVRAKSEAGLPADPAAEFAALRRLRDAEAVARWAGLLVGADTTARRVDPFDPLSVTPGREPPWVRGRRPTEKMVGALDRAGVPPADARRLTFWGAKAILDAAAARREQGLCSYRQARVLRAHGVDPRLVTFAEASAAIDRLAANGWRWPDAR